MKKIRKICLQDKQVLQNEEMGHVVAGETELWGPISGDNWYCSNNFNPQGTLEEWQGTQLKLSAPDGNILAAALATGVSLFVKDGGSILNLIEALGYDAAKSIHLDSYYCYQTFEHLGLGLYHYPVTELIRTGGRRIF